MNNNIFITVRLGSTRLPRKALLEINGKPAIEHLIQRVKQGKKHNHIVLCTTNLREDDALCDIAKRNGIYFFRGSVTDKLERWMQAAKSFDVEFFVTADGDDLFCEPQLIDLAFEQYSMTQADFIEAKNIVCGAFTYGIKTSALEKACEIKGTDDTEMMWVYFKDTGLFRIEELRDIPPQFMRPEIRMTLDYEDDFKFFKSVFAHFKDRKDFWGLGEIINFLDSHPQVVMINQYLQEKFIANQKAKTKLVIRKPK